MSHRFPEDENVAQSLFKGQEGFPQVQAIRIPIVFVKPAHLPVSKLQVQAYRRRVALFYLQAAFHDSFLAQQRLHFVKQFSSNTPSPM